jgi:hypothetical protein
MRSRVIVSAFEIADRANPIGLGQASLEHGSKEPVQLSLAVHPVKKLLAGKKEADQEVVVPVLLYEVEELIQGVVEEGLDVCKPVPNPLLCSQNDFFESFKKNPPGRPILASNGQIAGAIHVDLIEVFSKLHRLVEYGAYCQIKEFFPIITRWVVPIAEKGVAVFLQAVKNALASVINQGLDMLKA